jgi:hypothetical protein
VPHNPHRWRSGRRRTRNNNIIYYTHQSFRIDGGAPVDTQTNARPNLYKNVELRVLRPQIICSRVASHHCGRSDRWISPVSEVRFWTSVVYMVPGFRVPLAADVTAANATSVRPLVNNLYLHKNHDTSFFPRWTPPRRRTEPNVRRHYPLYDIYLPPVFHDLFTGPAAGRKVSSTSHNIIIYIYTYYARYSLILLYIAFHSFTRFCTVVLSSIII